MTISYFCISPQMIQLFYKGVEKKSYLEFYNHYKRDFEVLSEKLKTVEDLPKNTMLKYYAHNFMDCFELLLNPNRQSVGDSIITPFHRSIKNAINNKNWNCFYRDNCHLADFVMRKARNQRIIDIYVVDGAYKYLSFHDRDCNVAKKKTEVHKSKNNGAQIVRPSISYEKSYEVQQCFETSATSRIDYSMTHCGKQVHFTCSTVSLQRTYGYSPSPQHVSTNQYVYNSAQPYQEKNTTSSCCPPQNEKTDSHGNQQNSSFCGKNATPSKCSICWSESSNGVQNQAELQLSQSNSQQKNSDPRHLFQNSQSVNNQSNNTYYNPSGSECQCSTFLKPFNDRADHQFAQPPLPSNQPHGKSGSTIRDSHTGCETQSSSNHSFNKTDDSRDKHKTLTRNNEQLTHSEELNRETYDRQTDYFDEKKRRVKEEAYRSPRSNYFDSLQNPRSSEISEKLGAGGCNDTIAYVENIKQVEDDENVKRCVNEKGQYSVPPKQESRMPPSSLTSNVQLDNQTNLNEAQIDIGHSGSLNSPWSIVSIPHKDVDTLKPFELNDTLRQSSEEMDISDFPAPENEQPQPLMLGDLWSDLDKPEPCQKPAFRSDLSVDRDLEDWKRYAEDVKQHTTNAFIDTEPFEPKITEKEYSEDEEENTTINRDFHRKYQEQTERNQEELRRKREERAARRREHEEELNKMRQESKQKYLMFFNCLGLKLRFEEQEHNWMDWIQGCKQCVSKLLEVFNQFVSEIRRNYRGLKNLSREDEADFQTEISFLLSDIMNTYNSLGDNFEQLTHLESMFEDVMFIKVLKKCIADSASRILASYTAAGELSEQASQDNFQNLQNTFKDLTPSLIYSTSDLRRICKEYSYSDNYENVQFPHIPSQNL